MKQERIDRLLDEALSTGTVPADASPVERAEVERLLTAAGTLRVSAKQANEEANASMPVARARFERFMAASQSAAPAPAKPARGSLFGWLFLAHRALGTAATAAAIGIVATIAVVVSQNTFSGVETASAQVLTPGDYVQVSGVVAGSTGTGDQRMVKVTSDFGEVEVALSSVTSVVDDADAVDPASIKKGDAVLISGLVQKDRKIAAQTLAVSAETAPLPPKPQIKELKVLRPGLEGRIVFLSLGEDGRRARVVLDVKGELLLLRITDRSLKLLLQAGTTPVGTRVSVLQEPGSPEGVFSLKPAATSDGLPPGPTEGTSPGTASTTTTATPPPTSPTRPAGATSASSATGTAATGTSAAGSTAVPGSTGTPAAPIKFTGFKGIVTGRVANVLLVDSARGPAKVVIRAETRLVIADSGLLRDAVKNGDAAIGHEVTVSGSIIDGRVIADLIVFGPKMR